MQHDHLAPATIEDAEADLAVRRARKAGGGWVVASVAAFWVFAVAGGHIVGVAAFACCICLVAIGIQRRSRAWRETRRQFGDATVQRARWRDEAERDRSGLLWWTLALVALMLASQAWRR